MVYQVENIKYCCSANPPISNARYWKCVALHPQRKIPIVVDFIGKISFNKK
jgi:hypothetical protein